jgi:RNA polymerase sigma-70 factor (ECF subfamily)
MEILMVETTDRGLVTRMLAGEERAFEAFFEAYFAPMFRFALQRLDGNEDAAEEVVQAALARAVTKLESWRGEAALLTWLFTFCRHEISAWWRKSKREPVMFAEDLPQIEAVLDALAVEDAESRASRGETARLVQVALDRLPRHYGDVLEWKYIETISVNEIASRLGIGTKAAESQLTRARAAFRDAFTALAAEGGVR